MKITILGAGYVGLVTGACFAEMGNIVTCSDPDGDKIEKLRGGVSPIYERGIEHLIKYNAMAKRLFFTVDVTGAIGDADVVFICVGTPQGETGAAELRYVFECAVDIGRHIRGYTVVVTKSTVPVGTTEKVREIIAAEVEKRGDAGITFDMANNPEFLKEGNAVADFMGPDRVVVGIDSDHAAQVMHSLYSPFLRTDDRVIFMSIPSSELTKYASNAMLATRISFMNEVALLAEQVGADVEQVRMGMARDRRIGKYFLYAGAGYGGSCFPKDISALRHLGDSSGREMLIVKAVDEVNRRQKKVIGEKVLAHFEGNVSGKKFAVWGLAFKPDTDDIREAPAIEVITSLRDAGASFAVHDPEALENTRAALGDTNITYHLDAYETLPDADALIVMTEWKEYRSPEWRRVAELMRGPVVFDGRNLYEPGDLNARGFHYFGIGHGEKDN